MKGLTFILAIFLVLGMLVPSFGEEASVLYVRKVENLPENFWFAMDASCVPALENSGVVYRDKDGNVRDVFEILQENGITHIRVRIWNDPYDENGNGYGGGNCDLANCITIGQRAAKCGLKLIVSFHYSDFWADPSKQMVPKAWKGITEIKDKANAVYEFTKECLTKLQEAGVPVDMVSVGNETNQYMCGEKTWFNIQYLMQAGAKATREIYPQALVALHFANPEKGNYLTYAKKMDYYQVDYDVFATSYYPYWHGTLENLSQELSAVAETYGKKVMVLETSYAYTDQDTDFSGNTISSSSNITKNYPFTVQGQANSLVDLTDTLVNRTTGSIGLCYWEGTWITVGTESWEENHIKWETDGSGWATSYAASYDPEDAGKYYGGCAVDNQALFGPDGTALESLQVFSLMKEGQTPDIRPDAIEDTTLFCDLNGEIQLPQTVQAVMTDSSRQEVQVTWNFTKEQDDIMHQGGVASYDITGIAGGMEAHCRINMVEYNFLTDDSFENGGIGWVFTDLRQADELYVEDKKTDSLTGSKHAHFWSAGKNTVEFTLEQKVENLPAGKYKFSLSIMGGDCGETEIYAYIALDGQEIARAPMEITSYGNWDTGFIPEFSVTGTETVTAGIYVRCEGTGNGAWGKIDDAKLNSVP